jgi:hypothetical protein
MPHFAFTEAFQTWLISKTAFYLGFLASPGRSLQVTLHLFLVFPTIRAISICFAAQGTSSVLAHERAESLQTTIPKLPCQLAPCQVLPVGGTRRKELEGSCETSVTMR